MTPAALRPRLRVAPAPTPVMRRPRIAPRPPSALTTLRFVASRGEWAFDCDGAPVRTRPGRMPMR